MEQSAPAPIRRIRQFPIFVQLVDAIERAGALDGDPRAGRKMPSATVNVPVKVDAMK